MKFRYLEKLAVADVAFEAYGKTLEEAFSNAALAMVEVQTNTKKVKPLIKKTVELIAEDKEALLFDWLSELLYLMDVEDMFFSKFDVKKIEKVNGKFKLNADVYGEKIDRERHELKVEVKAVSYSQMSIFKKNKKWVLRTILDV